MFNIQQLISAGMPFFPMVKITEQNKYNCTVAEKKFNLKIKQNKSNSEKYKNKTEKITNIILLYR